MELMIWPISYGPYSSILRLFEIADTLKSSHPCFRSAMTL